jgi:GntR family transcriptional repressor for pyruvate dehydrogenase complex
VDAQNVFRPVRVSRASDEVVQQIKAHIFDGRLAPGDQLPSERDLAEQFGLSRLTIRDALRVLESQGLVEIKVGARGGVFVARPRPERVSEMLANLLRLEVTTVDELVEARMVVETHVAALAADRASPEDLDAMEQAIARARAGRQAGDPNFIPHSMAFHLALADAAKNQVLRFTVTSFRTLFHEALAPLLPADDMAAKAIVDHQELLNAVRARDPERARQLMHDHLLYFAARVRSGTGAGGGLPRWWA